jgi:hypothetical protein
MWGEMCVTDVFRNESCGTEIDIVQDGNVAVIPLEAIAPMTDRFRSIQFRVAGYPHGPITRLVSPV